MKISNEGDPIPNGFSRNESRTKYQFRFNRLLMAIRYSKVQDATIFRFAIGSPKGSDEEIIKAWSDKGFKVPKYFTWDKGFSIKGKTGIFYKLGSHE